ncbi:MAG: hypothetical protein OER89_13820, partial [Gemmatimonadota bacterium]|nr:hypothetical protein [Gemmatimonadota bacterium]
AYASRGSAYLRDWTVLEPGAEPRAAAVLTDVDPPMGVPDFVTLPNGMRIPPLPAGAVLDEHGVLLRIERAP